MSNTDQHWLYTKTDTGFRCVLCHEMSCQNPPNHADSCPVTVLLRQFDAQDVEIKRMQTELDRQECS